MFAFQLAHAMAHVALRHATRKATRSEMAQLSAEPLKTRMPNGAADLSITLGLIGFARTLELEADSVAAGTVAAAGYDTEAMARHLEASTQPNGPLAKAFDSQPQAAQRVSAIRAAAAKLPAQSYCAATGAFDQVKDLAAPVR